MDIIIERITEDVADFTKKHIPSHLIEDYEIYISLIASSRLVHQIIEKCIEEKLLTESKNKI